MKLQYLGDVKDCFKWDYLDYLVSEMGYPFLNIALMMTPDDSSRDGRLDPSGFDARSGIVEFCKELQWNRSLDYLKKLPEVAGSTYSIAFHKECALFENSERSEYFSGIDGKDDQVLFLDPDNGFEPEKSCNEKHIKYSDIEEILGQLSEKSIVVVFQHQRRKAFFDDFMGIEERIPSGYATAIYWQSLMFVAISKLEEVINRVILANTKYSEKTSVGIIDCNRKTKYVEQSELHYRAIGNFIVKYEHLSHEIQSGIIWSLHTGGLGNQQMAQVVVAHLPSQSLVSTFQAMISELVDLDEQESQILKIVFKRIKKLVEQRNLVIHTRWWVGWGIPGQPVSDEVSGWKYQRNKNGAKVSVPKFKVSDFDALSVECDNLKELVIRLVICVSEGYKISDNFQVNDHGNVSIVKGSNR